MGPGGSPLAAGRGAAALHRVAAPQASAPPSHYEAALEEVVREVTERLQADARARFAGRVGAGQVRQLWRDSVRRLESALRADCEGV